MRAEGRQRGISVREFCRLRIRRGGDEATLYVIEEACQKYAGSKGCTVVTADKPMQPIDKGLPGPVLDPALPRTRTGRIRTCAGNRPYTVYDYTPDRSRKGPDAFLPEFHGSLQADAYSGYVRSMVLLAYIRLLYDVERQARVRQLSGEDRWALRQARSRPIPDDIRAHLEAERPKVLPKSPEGQAMAYTLSNWAALVR